MIEYQVEFSVRFFRDIASLTEQPDRYSNRQTAQYQAAILERCESLNFMPLRFSEVAINHRSYRLMRHKAHNVIYQIEGQTVFIVALLHQRQLPENWL